MTILGHRKFEYHNGLVTYENKTNLLNKTDSTTV
jgi:hypothetical protein